jgi:hypothetical protein
MMMQIYSRPLKCMLRITLYKSPPEFSDQIWADWEGEKREQFGSLWDNVSAVLSELKLLGIYILDPSPSNIRFHSKTKTLNMAWGQAPTLAKARAWISRHSAGTLEVMVD